MRLGNLGRAAGATVGLTLLLPACTDDVSDEPTPTPAATSSPSASYQKGERAPGSLTNLCRSVSTSTLRTLGMKAPHISITEGSCTWSEREWSEHVYLDQKLTVDYRTYEPPQTRREYSATDEAKFRFRRLDDWERLVTSPVRGMGEEAKLVRQLDPTSRRGTVWLAVRQRNVVLDVRAEISSGTTASRGRVATYGVLERGALGTVRDLLGELTGKPVPSPASTPASAKGQVTDVGDVCRSAGSAGRLVPGVRRWEPSRRDSGRSGGCAWSGGDYDPELTVEVEAVPASVLDGATGTQVARQLFYGIYGSELDRKGLGDEAKIDWFVFESGRSRTVDVYARRGNLLVSVEYERWQHPSKKQMERDVFGVVEDVLAAYR